MLQAYRVVGAPSRSVIRNLSYGLFFAPVALGLSLLAVVPRPAPTPVFAATPKPVATPPRAASSPLVATPSPAIPAIMVKNVARAPAPPRPAPFMAPDPVYAQARAPAAPRSVNGFSANVEISQDGRLIIRGETVALAGVGLPAPDRMCRRLDGVDVPCIERIVARLAIITRGRKVVCDTRALESGERVGRCRADKIDLAEDLVQSRLVERNEAAATPARRTL